MDKVQDPEAFILVYEGMKWLIPGRFRAWADQDLFELGAMEIGGATYPAFVPQLEPRLGPRRIRRSPRIGRATRTRGSRVSVLGTIS